MIISGEAVLLRIFIGESDKIGSVPVSEKIVILAKENKLAGATVFKGIMGFGKSSVIHHSKFLTISEDLPIIIEIIDTKEKIDKFIPAVNEIFENANCGGIISIEKATIIQHRSENRH